MKNKLIRTALFNCGVKQFELADAMGVHEQTLSRKLRHELSEDEQKRIVKIIKEIAGSKNGK